MRIFDDRCWAMAALMSLSSLGLAGEGPSCQPSAAIRENSSALSGLAPAPTAGLPGGVTDHASALPSPESDAPAPPPATPPPSETPEPAASVSSQPLGTGLSEGRIREEQSPPPGTLGQTYRRRSALVPDDVHPRTGVVMVDLPEDADVSSRGLTSSWTGEAWRLETAQPLLPGMPHIYAIRAQWDAPEGRVYETRWVRLIMGRVVDLEF